MKELTTDTIKKKLSGKYERLYPIYEKLRDELSKSDVNLKFILKTIYILIESSKGTLGVIFWKEEGLHLAISSNVEHDRIINGEDLKYKGFEKKIIIRDIKDIDNFVLNLLIH